MAGGKQCWCYICAGAPVHRTTWINHGRVEQPLRPVVPPAQAPTPVLSMPEEEQKGQVDAIAPNDRSDEADDEDDDSDDDVDPYDGWAHLACDRTEATGEGQLTAQEIVVFLLDWMHANKATDTSASFVWRLVQMLVPAGVDIPTFQKVKGTLRAVELNHLQRLIPLLLQRLLLLLLLLLLQMLLLLLTN
jgi:hypothetical protein